MWSGPGRDESERVAGRVRALVGRVASDEVTPAVTPAPRPAPRWRIDPGRRPAIAVGAAVLVAALLTGWWVLSSGPRTMPVPAGAPSVADASPLVPASGGASASPGSSIASSIASSSAPASEVVVDVAGKVRRPGLYRLPPGSRVDDALTAAGGALHGVDLSGLNLAAKLIDGQQIAVGRPGAAAPAQVGGASAPAGSGSGGAAVPGTPVNLNTATLDQLETLPGIGPALGQRILDYRTAHGSFGSVDQLDDVSGIGTVTFARLKPLVSV